MATVKKPSFPLKHRSNRFKGVGPVERRSHRDDASDTQDAFAQLLETVSTVRTKLESERADSAEITEALQDTVRRVLTLTAHLEDGIERANVFNVVASSAEGAAMQQAMSILSEAEVRFEVAMRDDPPMDNEDYSKIDPETVAADQIAIEHNVTKYRANKLLLNAILVHRCTHVWNAMMKGAVTAEISTRIAKELKHVSDPMLRAEIEARILDITIQQGRCARWSAGMTKRLHSIIRDIDPDAIVADDKDAELGRRVGMWSPNAAETVVEANLPTVEAEAVWSAVDGLAAKWSQVDGETRTASQRRADALVQMVTGIDKRPEGDTSPIGAHCCTPHVTLLADISADSARDRAFTSSGCTLRQRLDDLLEAARKATLTVVPFAAEDKGVNLSALCETMADLVARINEEATYKPSTAVRRLVVERDGTCRFPGCNVSAHKCDLDHVNPFDHDNPLRGGLTREDNLIALCRSHHRDKTHGSTTYRFEADGSVSVDLGQGTRGTSEPNGLRGIGRQNRGLEYPTPVVDYSAQLGKVVEAATAVLDLLARLGVHSSNSTNERPNPHPSPGTRSGPLVTDFKQGPTRAERREKETEKFRAGAEDRALRRQFGANALDPDKVAERLKPPPY